MGNYRRIYQDGHYYFITIVTCRRRKILIDNIGLLRQAFASSKQHYRYELFAVTILPDHIHMLIKPEKASEYPAIISYIKRKFTYLFHQVHPKKPADMLSRSRIKKRESDIWQRRFYEHTVRDEKTLYLYTDYIHYNPVRHGLVDKAKAWRHSSFSKFVERAWYDEEWCDFSSEYDFE